MENENMDKEELKEEIKSGTEDLEEEKIHEDESANIEGREDTSTNVEEASYIKQINIEGWKEVNNSENFMLVRRKLFRGASVLGLLEEMRKHNFVFRGILSDTDVIFEKIKLEE